jgi:hypothetical protein
MKRSADEAELNPQSHKKVVQIAKLIENEYGGPSLTWFDRWINIVILREMDWSALIRMRQTCRFYKDTIDQLGLLQMACNEGFQRLVKMCVPVFESDGL